MIDKQYTVKEVAEILKTSEITIRRYINEEKIKNTFYCGNKHLIPETSLKDFLEKGGSEPKYRV